MQMKRQVSSVLHHLLPGWRQAPDATSIMLLNSVMTIMVTVNPLLHYDVSTVLCTPGVDIKVCPTGHKQNWYPEARSGKNTNQPNIKLNQDFVIVTMHTLIPSWQPCFSLFCSSS
ncbi:hypothetical protein AMECASPLE_003467 [Ameca splendens]|uniref:Uncharacterized protein n=1 Tax=Ameca splendens TaxID=208324 RepID=A0ABV0YLW7_9TELE